MKKALFIVLPFIAFTTAFTQSFIEKKIELNPEFIEARNQNQEKSYIPSLINFDFSSYTSLRSAISLPALFDSRANGIVPSIRDQGDVNTCWTFSTLDALQINWANMGLSNEPYSAENLANCHGFVPAKNNGGNSSMAIAYLSRYSGPYKETADSYINSTVGTCNTSLTKTDKGAYMMEAVYLPKQTQTIKQMVYRYGAVFTSANSNALQSRYNYTTYSTYTPDSVGFGSANHAGAIVGWDDDYVVTIDGYDSPSNPGAWIVRNTLGTSSDNLGYYYASYEDFYIGRSATVYTKRVEKEDVDTVYFSDKLGATSGITASNIDSIISLSLFSTSSAQTIKYIGFYTYSSNTYVDIDVFQTKSGETLSNSLGYTHTNLIELPGYHTLPINASISGDFYVRIQYKTTAGTCTLPIEASVTDFADVDVKATGSQWFKFSDIYDSWRTIGTGVREYNLCVKVYASDSTETLYASPSNKKICTSESVTFTNNSQGSFNSFEWSFGNDATPSSATTTSTSETVTVQYTTNGLKNITLKGITGTTEDSVIISGIVEVLDGPALSIENRENDFSSLKNKTIAINATGAESYLWLSPSSINGDTSASINYNVGEANSYVKVQAAIGSCTTTDSVLITVTEDCAQYDDIADAKELTLETTEGPFSNECATWEINEPIPPATDCISQTGWCSGEDNLNNSLWFKFSAPTSGTVNITTSGMDNKIALYNAKSTGTYLDIISGDDSKYDMIAANDDASGTEAAASISNATGLISGKTYWIQLDGSYNGSIGSSYIKVSDANASEISENSLYNIIISNPARNGLLAIRNASAIKLVKVFDLTGNQLVQADHNGSQTLNLNLQYLNEGYYILRIENEGGYRAEKILLTK